MATSGLLQWANHIRLAMATDPGRALFKEQVQTHGFSFLDDYLDNILSNAKQDTLLELVKTPGRKRTLTKKPKTASKLKQGITLFSEEEITTVTHSNLEHHPSLEDLAVGLAQTRMPNTASVQVSHCHVPEASNSPHDNINELSIIAEDDEMAEQSRVSLPLNATSVQPPQEEHTIGQDTDLVKTPASVIFSGCIRDSAPKEAEPQTSPVELHENTIQSAAGTDGDHVSLKSELNGDSQKYEIPEHRDEVVPEPQSSAKGDVSDNIGVVLGLRDSGPAPVSPKAKIPSIPPIPASAALHKPLTVGVENPTVISTLGTATPGNLVPGKRTSWLQKARQANLAIANKKATMSSSFLQPTPTAAALLPGGMKRKSTDTFDGPNEDDNERHHKVPRTTMMDTAPSHSNINTVDVGSSHPRPVRTASPLLLEEPRSETRQFGEGDMLDLLKKTVEGLGSRTGKGAGKSLGGSAATALAEARAAAEARIAERQMKEEETMNIVHHTSLPVKPHEGREKSASLSEPRTPITGQDSGSASQSSGPSQAGQRIIIPSKMSHEPIFNIELTARGSRSHTATTTTPSTSPHASNEVFRPPPGPVFNKPPPVFVPPKQVVQVEKDNLPSSSKGPVAPELTPESAPSEEIFSKKKGAPIWMSSTQDTLHLKSQNINVCDEDDSWPMDDKLEEGVQWVYGNAKDDNTTWSSLPSQQNTANLSQDTLRSGLEPENQDPLTRTYSRGNFPDVYDTDADQRDEMRFDTSDSEVDEEPQNATIGLVQSTKASSQSQLSNSSSELQQSNVGFFGQATKLISNIIGSGTKAKPEVKKVLQMAAVAAKKQQEESDKKVARLKEMENRRQLAMQRKAEEEKARIMEQEKKLKEESERRKREREEHTDKRPLKVTGSRKEDDTMKKRKIEVEKKPDIKRSAVNPPKSSVKLVIKQPSALSSSTAYNSSFNTNGPTVGSKMGEAGIVKPGTTALAMLKGKGKTVAKATEEDLPLPSQIVQTQMAARAKAQLRAAEQGNEPAATPSESIELPDINSEYSDSEDEDRKRTFDPPDWAQSPELRQALQQQSTINPDDIFGAIRPLRMEEIFKTRKSRFRARTSSANWAGADRLTVEEEREYARRMGFK